MNHQNQNQNQNQKERVGHILKELGMIEILAPLVEKIIHASFIPFGINGTYGLTEEEEQVLIAYYSIETHPTFLRHDAPKELQILTNATHDHRLEILSDSEFLHQVVESHLF